MKNRYSLLFFTLFLSGALMAQTTGRIGEHPNIGSWKATQNNFSITAKGKKIAERVIDAIGLKSNFEIRAASIDNAAAVVYGGKRYILYNPVFIDNLIEKTGTQWAAISVLAHEIGHHLDGHTVMRSGSQLSMELEADEFSGYVLRKMGASLAEAQAAMKTIASQKASLTHPAQYDRLTSIAKGWSHADNQLAGGKTITKPAATSAPVEQAAAQQNAVATNNPPSLDQRFILGDVYFIADPTGTFHITSQYNLVKVGEKSVSVLAKLNRTNNTKYPYVLSGAQNIQLWVSSKGDILNGQGRHVGFLRNHVG